MRKNVEATKGLEFRMGFSVWGEFRVWVRGLGFEVWGLKKPPLPTWMNASIPD